MVLNRCYKSKDNQNLRLLCTSNWCKIYCSDCVIVFCFVSIFTAVQMMSRRHLILGLLGPAIIFPPPWIILMSFRRNVADIFGRVWRKLEQQNSKKSAEASNQWAIDTLWRHGVQRKPKRGPPTPPSAVEPYLSAEPAVSQFCGWRKTRRMPVCRSLCRSIACVAKEESAAP